jgi:hypothetical protein
MRRAALLLSLALLPAQPALAQGAFDGTWNVTVNCPPAGNAAGYVLRFPAQVAAGRLLGDYSDQRDGASLRLEGTINADGTALLRAEGITGSPTNTIGQVARGTPYRYTANARFSGRSGEGQRIQTRPCTLTFAKA